jgi:hypothetical protein
MTPSLDVVSEETRKSNLLLPRQRFRSSANSGGKRCKISRRYNPGPSGLSIQAHIVL